jgi:hypothetical protein
MLIQQCPYLDRDVTVAGASAGSALSVCAVCGTSGKSARKDDDEGQNAEWFTPSHLIRVRAHPKTRLLEMPWEAELFRCGRATCYLISKAVPKEEVTALLGAAAFRRLVNRRQVGEKGAASEAGW